MRLRARTGRRLLLVAAAAGVLVVAVALWASDAEVPGPSPPPVRTGAPRPTPPLPGPWPLSLAASAHEHVQGRFRSGDTLAGILDRAGVPATTVVAVSGAAAPVWDLGRILPGRPYRLYFDGEGRLLLVRYRPRPATVLAVGREAEGWRAARVELRYRNRPRFIRARISGSLEAALARTPAGRAGAIVLAQQVADIFAWDVDFAADLRAGDRVDLVVQERYLEEEFVGYGDILAVELAVQGRVLRAVRFQDGGDRIAYYTPEGGSLRRTFLRSPVRYTRISSRFTYRRIHPVLKVHRPHLGIDYAAPPGTPVQATADGIVSFAGYGSQAGRYIKIRHGGSYTSWYLHLSRFAQGIRPGARVRQGQIIGYVGKTGLATSYHLDYRLSRNGQFVDPLRIQFPAAEPVPDRDRRAFESQRDRWMELLRRGQAKVSLQLAGG